LPSARSWVTQILQRECGFLEPGRPKTTGPRRCCAADPARPGESDDYFTASLSSFDAVNRGTVRAGTFTGSPVCGFRAMRAFRLETLNVPNPGKRTRSPFLRVLVNSPVTSSTIRPPSALLTLSFSASFAAYCAFVIDPSRVISTGHRD